MHLLPKHRSKPPRPLIVPPQRKPILHFLHAWLCLHACGCPHPPSGLHRHLPPPGLFCLHPLINLARLSLSSQNPRHLISFLPSGPCCQHCWVLPFPIPAPQIQGQPVHGDCTEPISRSQTMRHKLGNLFCCSLRKVRTTARHKHLPWHALTAKWRNYAR